MLTFKIVTYFSCLSFLANLGLVLNVEHVMTCSLVSQATEFLPSCAESDNEMVIEQKDSCNVRFVKQ
jgi:hypothetical protein